MTRMYWAQNAVSGSLLRLPQPEPAMAPTVINPTTRPFLILLERVV
jgi:hypothetical protein